MAGKSTDRQEAQWRLSQIVGLAATFNRELSEPAQMAYLSGMSDVPRGRFESSVVDALRTCRFMPSVAELREFAGVEIPVKNRAYIAFDVLGRAVGYPGSYRSVVFDDPILNATVQSLGGWIAVCETNRDEWESFFRKRFMEAYAANFSAKRGTMHHQVGVAEQVNGGNGAEVQPAVSIACGMPTIPGLSYERPKSIGALIQESVRMIGEMPTESK